MEAAKDAIRNLYKQDLSDAEVFEAKANLFGFFELLVQIDQEQRGESNEK